MAATIQPVPEKSFVVSGGDGVRLLDTAIETSVGYRPLRASDFHSYTIIRLIPDGKNGIRMFDEADLIRKNRKGMFIDVSRAYRLPQLEGHYFLLQRDRVGDDERNCLSHFLEELRI